MNLKTILPLLALLIGSAAVRAAERIDITLNSGWYFHHGDTSRADEEYTSTRWEKVNLPHTWNRLDAFDEVPGYYRGVGWYACPLTVPAGWQGRRIILHFEGANQVAEVFVNGIPVGSHTGGYTAFNFDITDQIDYTGKNWIKVRLDNSHDRNIPPLNADFTFYGGIYRNVRLMVLDPVHFDVLDHASDEVFVETEDVCRESAAVRVRGTVVNRSDRDREVVVETVLYDQTGIQQGRTSTSLRLKAGTKAEFSSDRIRVSAPELWSPENPHLYRAVTRIKEQGSDVLDQATLPVGFRWFEFNGSEGFKLNGEKYVLRGTNRHQDFAGLENALPDEYHRNDYRKIKELGFNFVRLAHYPQSPEVYRLCDELGLLVWTEIPIVNEVTDTEEFTANSLRMMTEQIRQTYNHPSVILYGYMNEILIRMLSNRRLTEEQRAETAAITRKLAHRLEELTKREAPGRNTVMAIHYEDGYNTYEVSTITDVLGYNLYFGWYYETLQDLTRYLSGEHEKYPDRPIIVSEFGPCTDIRNHTLVPRPWDFSEEYQVIMHASYLEQMGAMPYLAGYALWNFADFGAENRGDAIPFINQKGLVNYDRTEKDVASLYRAHNLPTPVLYIASRNYTDRKAVESAPGTGTCVNPIKVFSNGRTVELKLNGRSLGRKNVANRIADFEVPFTDGDNLLEATDDNGTTDRLSIRYEIYPERIADWTGNTLAVNVGSYQTFVDPADGTVWIPDREYVPGSFGRVGGAVFEKNDRQRKVGIANNILGTENNPLFQTFVEGIEQFRFDVPDGHYDVVLCFVENNAKSPAEDIIYNLSTATAEELPAGLREFDVSANGEPILANVNLARDYGHLRAVQYTVRVQASERNGINLAFNPLAGKTTLSGIKLVRRGM